eukprot:11551440-Heterocapsa_arctica.AAC.1
MPHWQWPRSSGAGTRPSQSMERNPGRQRESGSDCGHGHMHPAAAPRSCRFRRRLASRSPSRSSRPRRAP